MLRASTVVVEVCLEAEDSPAAGEVRWVDAAAAMGTEKKERRRVEVARRKLEANTLAVAVGCGGGAVVGGCQV